MNKICLSAPNILPPRLRPRSFASVPPCFWPHPPTRSGRQPWENAVNVLKTAFTGPIATGLSLVAIVVGGLMFAFGEGQSKRVFAGIVFGIGMAVGAVNFMAWLFRGSRHAHEPSLQSDESSADDSGSGAAVVFRGSAFGGRSFQSAAQPARRDSALYCRLIAAQRATKFDTEILRVLLNSAKFKLAL